MGVPWTFCPAHPDRVLARQRGAALYRDVPTGFIHGCTMAGNLSWNGLLLGWIGVVVHVVPAVTLDVTVTVQTRHPFYVATVRVDDVPPGLGVVTTYVPLHLRHAVVTGWPPATCSITTRTPFGGHQGEAAAVICRVEDDDPAVLAFTVNGTAAYEPIRFPVVACRPRTSAPPPSPVPSSPNHTGPLHGPDAPTATPSASPAAAAAAATRVCRSNVATWALLSPLDRIAACQVVGVVAFGFWLITMCLGCVCCLRYRIRHPYVPLHGRTVELTGSQHTSTKKRRPRTRRRRAYRKQRFSSDEEAPASPPTTDEERGEIAIRQGERRSLRSSSPSSPSPPPTKP